MILFFFCKIWRVLLVILDFKISELHKKARCKLTALSAVFVAFFCPSLAFCLFNLTIKQLRQFLCIAFVGSKQMAERTYRSAWMRLEVECRRFFVTFAVFHCRLLRGVTFCSHRKYAHGVTGSSILQKVISKSAASLGRAPAPFIYTYAACIPTA